MNTLAIPRKNRKPYRVNGKFYGTFDGMTFRRPNATLYRALDGYSIDQWLVAELLDDDCQQLEFTDKAESRKYGISLTSFVQHAGIIDHPGWNRQLCCPRTYWRVVGILPKQLTLI